MNRSLNRIIVALLLVIGFFFIFNLHSVFFLKIGRQNNTLNHRPYLISYDLSVSIRQTTSFAKANLLLNLCHEKTDRKQYA